MSGKYEWEMSIKQEGNKEEMSVKWAGNKREMSGKGGKIREK